MDVPNKETYKELNLFFNNSIFGAFFMEMDEPVWWNEKADKKGVMDYVLHHLRLTRVNQAFLDQYEAEEKEMIGMTPFDFFEHDIEQEIELLTNIFDNNGYRDISYEKRLDGTDVVFEGDYEVLKNKKGQITGVFGVQKDISDRIEKERALQSSLEEKKVLLSEIHHRVKNNLAVISAMLNLQAYETEDKTLEKKLEDSMHRIKTMAMVHELLYQSEEFSKLSFPVILKRLVNMVSETFHGVSDVEIVMETDDIDLNVNQAIPASLIVNEVVSNVFKHAFPGKEKGEIRVRLKKNNGSVDLFVEDDGVGFNYDEVKKNKSLGLKLIEVLSKDVGSSHSFESTENGTVFKLTFSPGKRFEKGSESYNF